MTGPRLPAIGDHVWRAAIDGSGPDARPGFDGYVCQVDPGRAMVTLAPVGVEALSQPGGGGHEIQETHGILVKDTIRVATLFLVRRLHGWRWVPQEVRPEIRVGDTIMHPWDDGPTRHLVIEQMGLGIWMTEKLGGSSPLRVAIHPSEIARAIAGLDGWSWIPAGWPGEPAAGEEPR